MHFSFDDKLQKHSDILIKASEFYANILMDKKLTKKILLDFEVDSSCEYEAQVVYENTLDECLDSEFLEDLHHFTITFSRFHPRSIETHLKTLAHEMVHVKQYATGELSKNIVLTPRGKLRAASFWQGTEFKFKRGQDEYWDSPWEITAYGMEEGLYRRFRKI